MTTTAEYSDVVQKWMPVLKKCNDVREEKYPLLAQAFENQFVHQETVGKILGEDGGIPISDFTRFALPILRNTVPFFGVNNLVGVQCAVNGLIIHRSPEHTQVSSCQFKHHNTFSKTLEELGVDGHTPDADRKLAVQVGNGIIRYVDDFVVAELLRESTKYENLAEAMAGTEANWIMASREVVDGHDMFKHVVGKRGGHAFDEIYEGGYRSNIRPDGTLHGHRVFVHAEMGNGKVLVGRRGDDFSSSYILGLGVLLLRSESVADLDPTKKMTLMSALSSHKFDMTKYGYVELT